VMRREIISSLIPTFRGRFVNPRPWNFGIFNCRRKSPSIYPDI
jgi:hypothetical protein